MSLANVGEPRGVALVHDKKDFENFIEDLYLSHQGYDPFVTDEEWCSVFCDSTIYPTYFIEHVGKVMRADGFTDMLDPFIYPEEYPALVVYNFRDANIDLGPGKGYTYETLKITDLDVISITTKSEKFSVAEF